MDPFRKLVLVNAGLAAASIAVFTVTPVKAIGQDPDTRVPKYSSLTEACKRYKEQDAVHTVIKNRIDPFILKHARRASRGETTSDQYSKITGAKQRELFDADQRYLASQVAVLRAAGYKDWKMYTRYSMDGIRDLWEKNVKRGERVADNPEHKDFKYTYMSFWTMDVRNMCKELTN